MGFVNTDTPLLRFLLWFCICPALIIDSARGMQCYDEKTNLPFDCPSDDDKPDEVFCCGELNSQRCCNAEEHKIHGTALNYAVLNIIGLITFMFIVVLVVICCCCCCQCCVLYKIRERRRANTVLTMTPMQHVAPVPTTDAAGRPLYPVQQYYAVAQQGYVPQLPPQYSVEAPQPNYAESAGGAYGTKPLGNAPNFGSNQPFTYGPAPN